MIRMIKHLWFASRSAAVIFVAIVAMMSSEVQRTGNIILSVRCTSLFLLAMGYKYDRRATA